jgi:hypothetical protein
MHTNRIADIATGSFLILSFCSVMIWLGMVETPWFFTKDKEATYALICVVALLVSFAFSIGLRIKATQKEPKYLSAPPQNLSVQAIGRSKDVKAIFVELMQSKLPLVATGIGGLGKTTVVQLIWENYKNKFTHVAYLSADAYFTDDEARKKDNGEYFLKAFSDNQSINQKAFQFGF